jgi:histidine triad (HIT) family protein
MAGQNIASFYKIKEVKCYHIAMEDSIFTKIIKGEIPSHKVYEDDKNLAFMDIHPAQPGHVLVIPKLQVEYIWDLSDEDYASLMQTVHKVGKRVREVLKPSYVGMSVEGIGVPHTHVHIIPFESQEEFHRVADQNADPDHEALAAMAKRLAL